MLKSTLYPRSSRQHRASVPARILIAFVLTISAAGAWLDTLASGGYALEFSGLDNYAVLGVTDNVLGGTGWTSAKTVSLWIKVGSEPAPATAPLSGEVILAVDRPRLFGVTRARAGGRDALWVWNVDSNGVDTLPVDYTPGEWLHLALVHDGSQLKVYKNGLPAGSRLSGPTLIVSGAVGQLYLGGAARNNPALNFAGQVDEVRLWQAALDDATLLDWIHRELAIEHPQWPALTAYYRMSNGSGSLLADDSGHGQNAALLGGMSDANWVASTAPINLESTATFTNTGTPAPSQTPTNTPTPSDTPTDTPTPSDTPNDTPTPSDTPTETPTPSDTPAPSDTLTPSNTPTATHKATDTSTPTQTPTPSDTPTPTSTPDRPVVSLVEVGWFDTPGDANDVVVSGSLAYVAATTGGLRIYDLSNPAQPTAVGFHATPRQAYGVTVQGSYAYVVAMDAGLRIFDVSKPAAPVEVGLDAAPTYAWDVAVEGSYAYVANRWEGLWIYDVSDPAHPLRVGTYQTPDQALDVVIQGAYAFVAGYEKGGLHILNVTNPAAPFEVGVSLSEHRMYGVEIFGNCAAVADGGAGLGIIDVSNPAAPVVAGYIDSPGFARSLKFPDNGLIYLADWNGGLRVIDITDPIHPFEAGFLLPPGKTRDVAVYLNYAVLANYEGGLRIVRVW